MSTRRGGFTLIEMMAVVFFTAIVMVIAVNFFIDLSRASEAAMENSRSGRRAVAVIDRVASDLESAVLLVKPAEVDPLEHPWLFVAEQRGGAGADRIKFIRRGQRPRSDSAHQSDLEVVAYFYQPGEIGGDLYRASWPRLPEALDRSFPAPDQPGVALLADEIAEFGIQLLGEGGEWQPSWDSTTVIESAELPLAAEISVAIWEPALEEALDSEPRIYTRRVQIPVRPIDLAALLDGQSEEDDEEDEDDEDCVTVQQCQGLNPEAFAAAASGDPILADLLADEGFLGQCFEDHAGFLDIAVEGCE